MAMEMAVASFDTAQVAIRAVRALVDRGFAPGAISLVTADDAKAQQLGDAVRHLSTGAAAGEEATPYAAWGHDRYWIVGQVMAGGSQWPQSAQVGLYRSFTDAFVERVRASDLPDEALDWYQERLDQGEILVAVQASGKEAAALDLLVEYGGTAYPRHGHGRLAA